jgi:hypothetical protein
MEVREIYEKMKTKGRAYLLWGSSFIGQSRQE